MKTHVVYLILLLIVGIVAYLLGNRFNIESSKTLSFDSSSIAPPTPIPLDRAQKLNKNFGELAKVLPRDLFSLLSQPIEISTPKKDLNEIFSQPNFNKLIAYPGINADDPSKPFFTIILIGKDSLGNFITTQRRTAVPGQPEPPKDVIQDDNRPCKPCPPTL